MERFEESQTLQMPKEKDVWETVERENPNINAETLDRLKKDIDYVVDHARDGVSSSIKNNTISQMLREFSESHTESETLSVLASYIEAMPARDDSGLFYLLDTVRGAEVLMKKDERKAPAFENLSTHLARTLTQEKIWEDDDRSCRGIIFGVLQDMPIGAMTEEGRETILNSAQEFIDRIKVMRNNPRGFCIDDIAEALRFTHPEMNREERMTEAERIIFVETDDSGWPVPEARNLYDDDDDFYLDERGRVDEFDVDDYEDVFPYHEENDRSRGFNSETIDDFVKNTESITKSFPHIPEKLLPAMNLHIFNDFLRRGSVVYSEKEKKEVLKKFKNFIEEEKQAEESPYLPTIGVEVEVPSRFSVDNDVCEATKELGIPEGCDEAWEFAPDFSYSAKTQSAIVHELIRGGFIETENDVERNGKKIRGSGDFSLHVNLGVYPDVRENLNNTDRSVRAQYENSVDVLTNALTYAFTSPERLEKRKTNTRYNTWKESSPSKKKRPEGYTNSSSNRIEIRSLEVRDKTLYRMLVESQLLGEALLSNFSEDDSRTKERLSEVWDDFESNVKEVLLEDNLSLDSIDNQRSSPYISAKALKETNIQSEMRNIITKSARKICYIIEESKKNQE